MIPKIIHYCWFGRNPLPESAQKCIASWRKFLPDYEIWQWSEEELVSSDVNADLNDNDNEFRALKARLCSKESKNDNVDDKSLSPTLPLREGNNNGKQKNLFDKLMPFDVNSIPYTQQAYEAKKYAFVSDYARFWILYKYGGLYFDTDVEVIKPMDDIIECGPFMGVEVSPKQNELPKVAPGLGLGVTPEHSLYKDLLDKYAPLRFKNADGSLNQKTIVAYNTEVLQELGLQPTSEIQKVAGVWIYPADYFNPLDSLTGKLKLTDNTRSLHWYMNSWSDSSSLRQWLSRMSHRLFGMRLHQLKTKLKF